MEKILNDDEKVRRAKELYLRRNNREFLEKEEQKNKKPVKEKVFFELLLIFNIAVIIFSVQNKEYIFTESFINQVGNYNMNIGKKIKDATSKFLETETNDVNVLPQEEIVPNSEIKQNVGVQEEASSAVNQMEQDIENLKAYSFINPVIGNISSEFGVRESKYQNVTGYHTGIDIALEKGSPIKASMQGIVTLVSDEGDYGNHIKIRCNNVITLYAHCENIFVKEGQIVAQGQDIATSGSTGNSTGPHLHFEIRVDDRYIDPGKILKI